MTEILFDALEGFARVPVPSLTDASIVSGFKRWTVVEGPIKVEYNFYQQGDGDTFASSDTFVTGLARPICAEVSWVNIDAADTALDNGPTCELEGVESAATFKTVTVHDADALDDAGLLVKVWGY
jgi:hypothetical protein